eukprot:409399_1
MSRFTNSRNNQHTANSNNSNSYNQHHDHHNYHSSSLPNKKHNTQNLLNFVSTNEEFMKAVLPPGTSLYNTAVRTFKEGGWPLLRGLYKRPTFSLQSAQSSIKESSKKLDQSIQKHNKVISALMSSTSRNDVFSDLFLNFNLKQMAFCEQMRTVNDQFCEQIRRIQSERQQPKSLRSKPVITEKVTQPYSNPSISRCVMLYNTYYTSRRVFHLYYKSRITTKLCSKNAR